MSFSIDEIIKLLEAYKYLVLFPITVFEGPLVTVAGGLFVSIGYLDAVTTYIIIIIADTVGDALHYVLGYSMRHKYAKKILKLIKIEESKLEKVEAHFIKHPKKSILLSKIAPGVGGMIQIAGGVAKMSFFQFITICFLGTIPKSLLLLFVGYTFGKYIYEIENYFSLGGLIILSISIILGIIYFAISKYAERKAIK